MSKLGIILTLSVSLASAVFAGQRVAPYFSLAIDQGVTLPSKGDWMYSLNLVNDLGVIVQPFDNHKFLGFYELRYTGPGLRRQEGERFSDRTMDHVLAVRHHWQFRPDTLLKTQIDYLTEKKRTGANEVWGQGLYDSNRVGGAVTLARRFSPERSAEIALQLHTLDFPNYTDLLSEYQRGGAAADVITGTQNQTVVSVGARGRYGRCRLDLEYTRMIYRKQKVVVQTVQSDGTYYSGDTQQDALLSGSFSYDTHWRRRIFAAPTASMKLKTSNQSYQYFTVATSTVPVQFFGNYYGYLECTVNMPVTLALTPAWDFFVTPEWTGRWYADRQARREDGVFLEDRQATIQSTFSVGFGHAVNAVTRVTYYYALQTQSSNTHYEKYLPYNYTAQYFGIGLQYTY